MGTEVKTLVLNSSSFNKLIKNSKSVKIQNINNQRTAILSSPHQIKHPPRASLIKSNEVVQWLLEATKDNLLFADMTQEEHEHVIQSMSVLKVEKDHDLIVQGESGNKYYVIEEGEFSVIIDGQPVAKLTAKQSFG